jgi:hypothetical protein
MRTTSIGVLGQDPVRCSHSASIRSALLSDTLFRRRRLGVHYLRRFHRWQLDFLILAGILGCPGLRQSNRLAGSHGFQNRLDDADIRSPFQTSRLRRRIVENALGEIYEFGAELVSALEGGLTRRSPFVPTTVYVSTEPDPRLDVKDANRSPGNRRMAAAISCISWKRGSPFIVAPKAMTSSGSERNKYLAALIQ